MNVNKVMKIVFECYGLRLFKMDDREEMKIWAGKKELLKEKMENESKDFNWPLQRSIGIGINTSFLLIGRVNCNARFANDSSVFCRLVQIYPELEQNRRLTAHSSVSPHKVSSRVHRCTLLTTEHWRHHV